MPLASRSQAGSFRGGCFRRVACDVESSYSKKREESHRVDDVVEFEEFVRVWERKKGRECRSEVSSITMMKEEKRKDKAQKYQEKRRIDTRENKRARLTI